MVAGAIACPSSFAKKSADVSFRRSPSFGRENRSAATSLWLPFVQRCLEATRARFEIRAAAVAQAAASLAATWPRRLLCIGNSDFAQTPISSHSASWRSRPWSWWPGPGCPRPPRPSFSNGWPGNRRSRSPTPEPARRLSAALAKVTEGAGFQRQQADAGLSVVRDDRISPAGHRRHLRKEMDRWAPLLH